MQQLAIAPMNVDAEVRTNTDGEDGEDKEDEEEGKMVDERRKKIAQTASTNNREQQACIRHNLNIRLSKKGKNKAIGKIKQEPPKRSISEKDRNRKVK